jgi:hypothetical protein
MAGNTKCYKVLVTDGVLSAHVVEFSPRFADSVAQALERLTAAPNLEPPIVRFGDWPELQRRWAARGNNGD